MESKQTRTLLTTILLVALVFVLFQREILTVKISVNTTAVFERTTPQPEREIHSIVVPTTKSYSGRCQLDKLAGYLHTTKTYCERTGNVYLTHTKLDHGMFEEGVFRAVCGQGKTVVEIGSYNGEEAKEAASLGCNVRVFEPSPPNREKLFATIANLTEEEKERIDVRPVAIGKDKGTLHFRATGQPIDGIVEKGPDTIEVGVIPLSDGVADLPVVDLLKIDTEGYEIDIMHSSLSVITPAKFKHITFEFSPSRIPHEFPWTMVNQTFQHLRSVGYYLYLQQANSLPPSVIRKKRCRVPRFLPACLPNAMHVGLESPAATRYFGIWTNLIATSSPLSFAELKSATEVEDIFSALGR